MKGELDSVTAHDFCLTEIFSFCREAKFGEFRLARSLQVVCWFAVSKSQGGEMV
jgi:hypothetical protein